MYITYDYHQLNRLAAVRDQNHGTLASYTYDSRSRRTGLDYVNGAGAAGSLQMADH